MCIRDRSDLPEDASRASPAFGRGSKRASHGGVHGKSNNGGGGNANANANANFLGGGELHADADVSRRAPGVAGGLGRDHFNGGAFGGGNGEGGGFHGQAGSCNLAERRNDVGIEQGGGFGRSGDGSGDLIGDGRGRGNGGGGGSQWGGGGGGGGEREGGHGGGHGVGRDGGVANSPLGASWGGRAGIGEMEGSPGYAAQRWAGEGVAMGGVGTREAPGGGGGYGGAFGVQGRRGSGGAEFECEGFGTARSERGFESWVGDGDGHERGGGRGGHGCGPGGARGGCD
eukprot:6166529-Pleurochrysis_carterae.AAC.1